MVDVEWGTVAVAVAQVVASAVEGRGVMRWTMGGLRGLLLLLQGRSSHGGGRRDPCIVYLVVFVIPFALFLGWRLRRLDVDHLRQEDRYSDRLRLRTCTRVSPTRATRFRGRSLSPGHTQTDPTRDSHANGGRVDDIALQDAMALEASVRDVVMRQKCLAQDKVDSQSKY